MDWIPPPQRHAIVAWRKKLLETGCVCVFRKNGSGKQSLNNRVIENIQQSFQRSPHKSICWVSCELGIPHSNVNDVVHKS